MQSDEGRDRAVERLLRRARPSPAEATSPCVDAETLAAWEEHRLGPATTAEVEAHLSVCPRCQAVLAALARSRDAELVEAAPATPGVSVSPLPFKKRSVVRWLAPLAAAAAAVTVWMIAPSRRAVDEMARFEESATRAVAPTPTGAPPPAEMPAPAGSSPAFGSAQVPAAEPTSSRVAKARQNESTPGAGEARRQRTESTPAVAAPEWPRDGAVSAVAPATATPDRPAASPSAIAPASPARVEALAEAAPAPASGIRAAEESADAKLAREDRVIGGTSPARDRAERQQKSLADSRDLDWKSPDGRVAWRVTSSGTVERQLAGRAAWQSAIVDPSVRVVAGAAPSERVCWLVGRGGEVLRSVDGNRFERVPFAGSMALVTVRAVDAQHATVTSEDGRAYLTSDGGQTWQIAR